MYDSQVFLHKEDIQVSESTAALMEKAQKTYFENFNGDTWYGRCIFVSWYCSLDCKFCYRATIQHQKRHSDTSRRSMGTMLLEALFCKVFNWRIEFLTGGYATMPFDELLEIIKNVSIVYGEKMWLNLGVLPQTFLEQCRPYVKGIVSSMETMHPEIHKEVCPNKPIEPYDRMFSKLEGFKKSICIIVGLGDKLEDLHYLYDFIEKHNIERITLYALKPVKGTGYTKGPSSDEYLSWMASIRNRFPKLEIIAGTNLRRCEEAGHYMKAGANAITKFPATQQFGTEKAKMIDKMIRDENRNFTSNITEYPDIDWEKEIDSLEIKEEYKLQMKEKLGDYLKKFKNPRDKDPVLRIIN